MIFLGFGKIGNGKIMIIVRLMGGLGNQLFQYAIGRNLSSLTNARLKFDFKYKNPQRPFQLNFFSVSTELATWFENDRIAFPFSRSFSSRFVRFIQRRIPNKVATLLDSPNYVQEKTLNFDPELLIKVRPSCYLDGYWQSEKYFSRISNELRKELLPRKNLSDSVKKFLDLISANNSVSLHVRRGDYVKSEETNQFHGVCSKEYYAQSWQYIAERIDNPSFYIFSDDMEWAKTELSIPFQTVYVSDSKLFSDGDELWMMSRCKHHIIANSSFSWWGAWLSYQEGSITIAPKKWFASLQVNLDDRLPASWIRL